jgi:hypothetical protein
MLDSPEFIKRSTLNDLQFQPFIQGLFNELVVCLRNFELLPVDWILRFEMNFVFEILAKPKSCLSMLTASWFLHKTSRYHSWNSSGTCKWHRLISSLDNLFLFTFGKWLWISWQMDEMKSSMRGTSSSSSVSMNPRISSLSSRARSFPQ